MTSTTTTTNPPSSPSATLDGDDDFVKLPSEKDLEKASKNNDDNTSDDDDDKQDEDDFLQLLPTSAQIIQNHHQNVKQQQGEFISKRPKKGEIDTDARADDAALSFPVRNCEDLFVAVPTLECATKLGCIPCAYKVACFDVALDNEFCQQIPNQRPELCPRHEINESKQQQKNDNDKKDRDEEEQRLQQASAENENSSKRKRNKKKENHENKTKKDLLFGVEKDCVQHVNAVPTLGYDAGMRILTVGDGDFTFSLAVARILSKQDEQKRQQHAAAVGRSILEKRQKDKEDDDDDEEEEDVNDSSSEEKNTNKEKTVKPATDSLVSGSSLNPVDPPAKSSLIATSYETKETLVKIYPDIEATFKELESLGATLCFQVDGTKLTETLPSHIVVNDNDDSTSAASATKRFDRIVWNFPCTADPTTTAAGQDGQNAEMDRNKCLVREFMTNAWPLLDPVTGQVHLNHKTKPPFNQWKIEHVALEECSEQMEYLGRIVFDRCLLPPYIPRKALLRKGFPTHDACTYVFQRRQENQQQSVPSSSGETKAPFLEGIVPVTPPLIQSLREQILLITADRKRLAALAEKNKKNKRKKGGHRGPETALNPTPALKRKMGGKGKGQQQRSGKKRRKS